MLYPVTRLHNKNQTQPTPSIDYMCYTNNIIRPHRNIT